MRPTGKLRCAALALGLPALPGGNHSYPTGCNCPCRHPFYPKGTFQNGYGLSKEPQLSHGKEICENGGTVESSGQG